MCATQLNPNQPNQCFTASPVRARERQIRAPKKHILGGYNRISYSARVTVYPYNGHIESTNPIVRRVMSLTCSLKRVNVNCCAPKHVKTQPLQYSNTRAWAPTAWQNYFHRRECCTEETPRTMSQLMHYCAKNGSRNPLGRKSSLIDNC